MQLKRVTDPTKREITLEETDFGDLDTKGWIFKSFYGSDGNTYEYAKFKGTHYAEDVRIRWYILEED